MFGKTNADLKRRLHVYPHNFFAEFVILQVCLAMHWWRLLDIKQRTQQMTDLGKQKTESERKFCNLLKSWTLLQSQEPFLQEWMYANYSKQNKANHEFV